MLQTIASLVTAFPVSSGLWPNERVVVLTRDSTEKDSTEKPTVVLEVRLRRVRPEPLS